MRRADRLFQIIQVLRRGRGPHTADRIAAELETSKRTIYRDIAALVGQRVPIRGEAGVGYVLEDGFDLPPLMLTPDEIEACVLGAQWVAKAGDAALAKGALDLQAKIMAALPERLRPLILDPAVGAYPHGERMHDGLDIGRAREAIRAGCKIALVYRDETDRETRRCIWPIAIGYMDAKRLVVGWCELREDFRHFRADRVISADFLSERYPDRPGTLRARWRKARLAEPIPPGRGAI